MNGRTLRIAGALALALCAASGVRAQLAPQTVNIGAGVIKNTRIDAAPIGGTSPSTADFSTLHANTADFTNAPTVQGAPYVPDEAEPNVDLTNHPPSYYRALGAGRHRLRTQRTTISFPGSNTYVTLQVNVPDATANSQPVVEIGDDGENTWKRKSVTGDDTTWRSTGGHSGWFKVVDTDANKADLAAGDVANSSLANLDPTANTKLGGIAAGATKCTNYRATSAPTGGTYTTCDVWIDTSSSPRVHYNWTGSAWEATGRNVTATTDLSDAGALSRKSSVDLSTTDVTNKSLANVDGAAATKLSGIAAGATACTTYRATSAPTGGTYTSCDRWLDTSQTPRVHYAWTGSAWEEIGAGGALAAKDKLIASYQSTTFGANVVGDPDFNDIDLTGGAYWTTSLGGTGNTNTVSIDTNVADLAPIGAKRGVKTTTTATGSGSALTTTVVALKGVRVASTERYTFAVDVYATSGVKAYILGQIWAYASDGTAALVGGNLQVLDTTDFTSPDGFGHTVTTTFMPGFGSEVADLTLQVQYGGSTIGASSGYVVLGNPRLYRQPAPTDINGSGTTGRALLTAGTAAAANTTLGLTIGTNTEAWDADLDCYAALSATGFLKHTGAGTCSSAALASGDIPDLSASYQAKSTGLTNLVALSWSSGVQLPALTAANTWALKKVGVDLEAWDSDLDCVAALATTGFINRTGAGTCSAAALVAGDIPSLDWTKIATGKPTTEAGYGITDVLNLAGGTLTGELVTPASTTATAGLNLPHGASPTSPVNGDVWTTTGGLFVRINGLSQVMAKLAANTFTSTQTLATGTTALAPLKFVAGTNLTTPAAGSVEWDGTNLFLTQTTGPTRKTVAYTDTAVTCPQLPGFTGGVTSSAGSCATTLRALAYGDVSGFVGTSASTLAAGNDSRITGAEQTANKGAASGYAGLDSSGYTLKTVRGLHVTVATTATVNIASSTTNDLVLTKRSSAGAVTVNLPGAAPADGWSDEVCDGKGDAATNNVTLTPVSPDTINGASTLVINTAWKCYRVTYSATLAMFIAR